MNTNKQQQFLSIDSSQQLENKRALFDNQCQQTRRYKLFQKKAQQLKDPQTILKKIQLDMSVSGELGGLPASISPRRFRPEQQASQSLNNSRNHTIKSQNNELSNLSPKQCFVAFDDSLSQAQTGSSWFQQPPQTQRYDCWNDLSKTVTFPSKNNIQIASIQTMPQQNSRQLFLRAFEQRDVNQHTHRLSNQPEFIKLNKDYENVFQQQHEHKTTQRKDQLSQALRNKFDFESQLVLKRQEHMGFQRRTACDQFQARTERQLQSKTNRQFTKLLQTTLEHIVPLEPSLEGSNEGSTSPRQETEPACEGQNDDSTFIQEAVED